MAKILNNLIAAGLPALVMLFGVQILRTWWRDKKAWLLLASGACASLSGALTIANLAVSAQGRFFGRYTWGPRYPEADAAAIGLLVLAFLGLGWHLSARAGLSPKKPILTLAAIGGLVGLAFFLLETFG